MNASSDHDDTCIEDQLRIVELAEILEFVAGFLAHAEGPLLRVDFAEFTCGTYQLDELRADLRRFGGWLTGQGLA